MIPRSTGSSVTTSLRARFFHLAHAPSIAFASNLNLRSVTSGAGTGVLPQDGSVRFCGPWRTTIASNLSDGAAWEKLTRKYSGCAHGWPGSEDCTPSGSQLAGPGRYSVLGSSARSCAARNLLTGQAGLANAPR